jgi:hypothetical protein
MLTVLKFKSRPIESSEGIKRVKIEKDTIVFFTQFLTRNGIANGESAQTFRRETDEFTYFACSGKALLVKVSFKEGRPITYSPVLRVTDDGKYLTITLQNFDEHGNPKGEAPIMYLKSKTGVKEVKLWEEEASDGTDA